ncbi:MAG TPA: hypothetical protein VEU77_03295 [Candidatus Acidoferrales bacterium]|nr:hypothetical protein [Candidatus Acidoferrales bacterium]
MDRDLTRVRAWLDATPLSTLALAIMREATGRTEPIEQIVPVRAARLAPTARVAFWSMAAGAGTSTTAALVAQRSAAAGHAPLLVDLDRWVPSLALRASIDAATIRDVLVQPDHETELVSRWGAVPFMPGSPELHADFDADRIVTVLAQHAGSRALVLDLGAGGGAMDDPITRSLTRFVLVSGATASQLQAAFCARPLLRDIRPPVGLVVTGVTHEDASIIASRVGLPLLAAIPEDAYLARDEFAARAPTMRAIDALVRAL